MDGEESDGYGAGDIAAVGIDLRVEIFEGAGAVCPSFEVSFSVSRLLV